MEQYSGTTGGWKYKGMFSVSDLAGLCRVVPATVRRWRTSGLNGAKLEPYDEENSGGYLMFTPEAVRAFVKCNPKIMTAELGAALEEAEGCSGGPAGPAEPSTIHFAQLQSGPPVSGKSSVVGSGKNQYYLKLLRAREAELLRELDYVREEIALMEK